MRIIRNLGILLIATGIILLTVEQVSAYVELMTKEQEMLLETKENINKEYEIFLENIKSYKESIPIINSFYTQYYEEMPNTDKQYKENMKSIDDKAALVKINALQLENYCNSKYVDQSTNKKCDAYKENYKNFMKAYIKINDNYNEVIEEYNDWATETNHKTLEKYTAINYNEYSISI